MLGAEIRPGQVYAAREPTGPGQPFIRVRVLEKVRTRRWRVEFLDQDPPLVDYLKSDNIICPWGQRTKLARDEQRSGRLREVSNQTWPGKDHPTDMAVMWVLEASGEQGIASMDGITSLRPDAWERIMDRAQLTKLADPHAVIYTDRYGYRHAPWEVTLALAQAFAAAEPHTVLRDIEEYERRMEVESRDPGHGYVVRIIAGYRPGWALARSWAGFDAALADIQTEVHRLRAIIDHLIVDARRDGDDDRARAIERMLNR